MASYVEAALVSGERVVHSGKLSLWSVWHLLLFGLLLLPAFGLGLILWAVAYIRLKSTEIAVTTKRLIVKYGFIRRTTIEIALNRVESIQVDQSILGRMLDFGTLVVSGTGSSHTPIVGIDEPMSFRRAFIEAQEASRRDGLNALRAAAD